ncbi:hypothetical protein CSC70_02620 [Pseudoxanthomonas kalamensis DSM 18571]|uniref:sel1 repeat family protein n=1 Tax=Pseudoxanthomonas kalamensis TaxID=289483 RepID=UPI001390FBAA|nr:sel1 repeat family protein [Pseudoxanthomonas kalamensis]KAF1712433.1 hypothetical protein CSC70_02620 [Pseudoxanthomonas kalamensis DSM 18571]
MFLILLCTPFAVAHAEKKAEISQDVMTEGFLAAHPDLRWRSEGIKAYEAKNYSQALEYLQRAARYADKPSQAIIAEMYWRGVGVPQDRALGYAWMDIAAERLYHEFVVYRESYWEALDETQRADAIERGQAVLAEYGDDVAKPRLEQILRRERRSVTGSRLGFVGNITIIPFTGPLAGSGMTLSGDQYYDRKYWEPKRYWQLQDEIWKAPLRGRVDVGGVEQVDDAESGKDTPN